MTRPPKEKMIGFIPKTNYFKPRGVYLSELQEITLSLAQVESLRLVHIQGLDQTLAAKRMGVHQSTLQRILTKAEEKMSQAIVFGYALKIGNA